MSFGSTVGGDLRPSTLHAPPIMEADQDTLLGGTDNHMVIKRANRPFCIILSGLRVQESNRILVPSCFLPNGPMGISRGHIWDNGVR